MARAGNRLWGHRDFLKLWSAKTVSDFGSMVSGTALSFTAILFLKATPGQLGVLMAANLLPRFLIGPLAGVAADRLPRRMLMIAADLGRAALLVTIPLAAVAGRLMMWHLYAVTTITGLLSLLFDIADRAYLPTLVPAEALIEANSRLKATGSVAEFGAFSIGGWLVQWFTGPIAILIDAISFVFSAFALGLIRTKEPPRVSDAHADGIRGEMMEGWLALRRSAILLPLAVVTILMGFTGGIEGSLIVAYMARGVGFAPGVLGLIWSVGGLASLAGALLADRLLRRISIGSILTLGPLVWAIGILAVALARGPTWVSALLLTAAQLSDGVYTIFDITQNSVRQAAIAEHLQGRVNSLFETFGLGATLIGALLGGLLGEKLGLRAGVALGAAGFLAASAVVWLSPLRRAAISPADEQGT